jgi:hypothetical protein
MEKIEQQEATRGDQAAEQNEFSHRANTNVREKFS